MKPQEWHVYFPIFIEWLGWLWQRKSKSILIAIKQQIKLHKRLLGVKSLKTNFKHCVMSKRKKRCQTCWEKKGQQSLFKVAWLANVNSCKMPLHMSLRRVWFSFGHGFPNFIRAAKKALFEITFNSWTCQGLFWENYHVMNFQITWSTVSVYMCSSNIMILYYIIYD